MQQTQVDAALTEQRRTLLAVILARMYRLRFGGPPPPRFVQGEYYVEDPNVVKCQIICLATFSGHITTFEFWLNGAKVTVSQYGASLIVQIRKNISERLWDDIRWFRHREDHIIRYLRSYMPVINRNILDQRYLAGHLLNRTISMLDLHSVVVIVKEKSFRIRWPVSILPFLPNSNPAPEVGVIYVRDFIDACHSFFRNDYDDCIRRIITSAENFFFAMKWVGRPETCRDIAWRVVRRRKRPNPKSFRRILAHNLPRGRISEEVVHDNMEFIYTVRNRIVHDGFRMSTSCAMFCSKSIGTLNYLLGWYCRNEKISRYVHHLHMQFRMQSGMLGEYRDLDEIKRMNQRHDATSKKPIDSDAEFNHAMFSDLRFAPRDKASI
jgi:hypothetical protein